MPKIFPIDYEEKNTICQNDYILFSDSQDGNKIKKAQYSNLKGEKGDQGIQGPQGCQGIQGEQGPVGPGATVNVGSTTTGAAGTCACVTNSGTQANAVFDFVIPKGDKGDTGCTGATGPSICAAAFNGDNIDFTDTAGCVTILCDAKNCLKGDKGDTGSQGPSGTITVGSTTTLDAGCCATVSNSGTCCAAVFNFGIPKGAKGDTGCQGPQGPGATITIGTTTTLAAGCSATVTNSGTCTDSILNFGIPKGDKGDQGPTGCTGATGNGIACVDSTKAGKVTTVEITETNGCCYCFTVCDGEDGQGAGDVLGPASSTDGNVVLFDGNSGKLIKDSGRTLPGVVDDLTSCSTTDALSANQGSVLKGMIDDLNGFGKFLSLWDSSTGLPISFPLETPYTYSTGDYFLVETVDPTTNYKPVGSSYTGTASTTTEADEVDVGDIYIYDGSTWLLQINHGKSVSFANLAGSPEDNTALCCELNSKQDTLVSGTNIKTINSNSLLGCGNISIPTYSAATSSVAGIVKLGSDTTQSVSAEAVTGCTNRTYAVQTNASNQMVVNVPWVNTTYSAGTNVDITSNKVSAENYFIIKESDTCTTYTGEKGVAPYNTSYCYTNICINPDSGVKWKEGAIYTFDIDTGMIATSACRNVRVKIGSGAYIPVMGSSSILGGSSYFTKANIRQYQYSTKYQSGGALHLFTDSNTTYSAMTAAEATTGTCTSARSIAACTLKCAITHYAPISDTAYGAGWDGATGTAPSQNAVYDKIEAMCTVPSGGTCGQVLTKTADGYEWADVTPVIPTGYIDFLMVGGGGAAGACGSCNFGGGGGGGVLEMSCQAILSQSYPVVVGAGGTAGCCALAKGGNTTFYGLTAYGGGASTIGACHDWSDGGSGGGAHGINGQSTYGLGVLGQGHNGGVGGAGGGAGGGGAGAVGGNGGSCIGGAGGNGIASSMSGVSCYYGGGGGGTGKNGVGAGGLGGGGHGGTCNSSCPGENATYYGGGGGGAGTGIKNGNGYQGIVIVRYKSDGSCGFSRATGGNCCYLCNGYCIHTFTSDGVFTPIFG